MASDKLVTVTSESFDSDVLQSAPVLEELAEEMDGKVRIAKVNVDENQEIAIQFQVSSIPTFILFKDGQVADRMLGAMPKSAFEQFIERHA